MAINLNPGADATIAGAAARAGMALAPTDYGATFRDFSTKYQAAMATVGESWGTVIQNAGLKAAQIKESANKIRDNYGSNVTDIVFDDTKDLARQRFDIMKGYSGSYVNGEWVRGPKFSEMDDPKGAKQKAKQDWRKRKDTRFNQLRQMEQNVFEVGQHFVTNNVDIGALDPAEASMVDAIMNEGEYNEDGVRASFQLNEDGTEYTYVFYGEDDKPISGFDEITGAPMYVDKSDLSSDAEIGKMARTNVGLHSDRVTSAKHLYWEPGDEVPPGFEVDDDGLLQKIGQHQPGGIDMSPNAWSDMGYYGVNTSISMLLQGMPPDEVFSRERLKTATSIRDYETDKQTGYVTNIPGTPLSKRHVRKLEEEGVNMIALSVQAHLHRLGYDLGDHENHVGLVYGGTTGNDGIDGKWGKDSQDAFELFKKDQEEAKSQKSEIAGDLWSDISAQAEERTPLSLNTNKMSSLFTIKDVDAQEKMNTIGLERGLNSGLNTNLEFDENQVRQDINNIINDAENPANTLKHLMHNTVVGMEYSFKDYLTTPGTVYSEAMWQEIDRLGQMGLIEDTSGPGGAPDGKYTVEDFKDSDAANFRALAKEMLNPNNPKAKELYIDFLTNGVRSKFDAGRTAKGKGKQTKKTSPGFIPLTRSSNPLGETGNIDWKSESMMNNLAADIIGKKPIKGLDENNPITFVWDTNKESYVTPGGSPINKQDLFNNLLGGTMTNDFMMEDYYRSIPEWTSYSSGSGGGGVAGPVDFSGLTTKGWETKSIIASDNKLSGDNILFNYGNSAFVQNTLTREYGHLGFKFETEWGNDKLKVTFTNKAGDTRTETFEYNHLGGGSKDFNEAKRLQMWMEKAYGGGTGAKYN